MRDEVIVNGIKLTRKQVEDALAELNKPVWIPLPGSYKVTDYTRVVVFNSWLADKVKNVVHAAEGCVTCVNASNGEIVRVKLEEFSPVNKL